MNPEESISINKALVPGGKIVVHVPNMASLVAAFSYAADFTHIDSVLCRCWIKRAFAIISLYLISRKSISVYGGHGSHGVE